MTHEKTTNLPRRIKGFDAKINVRSEATQPLAKKDSLANSDYAMIKRRKKKPNWRLIRMRGKQALGTKDSEEVGVRRHELGPYDTEAEAKAEEETWRAMRLSSKLSKSEIQKKKPCSTESNAMTPPENQKSRFNVRLKKRVSDDGPAILAAPAPVSSTESIAGLSAMQLLSRIRLIKRVSDGPAILAAPAPGSSTESNAMTPLDQALENHMSRFNVRGRRIGDDGPAILARSLPPTMTDGSDDLIKAVTNCEAAFAELRRALVLSSKRLGQQTMHPPVHQATKPAVTE